MIRFGATIKGLRYLKISLFCKKYAKINQRVRFFKEKVWFRQGVH